MKNYKEKSENQLLNMCNNIGFMRKKYYLTQKEMAKRLKISTRSLSMLEKGIVPPNLSCEFLFHIYFEFNVSPTNMLKSQLYDD